MTTTLVLVAGAGAFVVLRDRLLPAGGACHSGTVRIAAVAPPDIAPALTRIADQARADHTLTDGRCLDVRVSARESSQVADQLGADGTKEPDFAVWIPDDRMWVDQLTASGHGIAVSPMGSTARSPVVIGALQAPAEGLGWPAKTYTWAELAGTVRSTGLRLGTPDPVRTATGMPALAMINSSIARSAASQDGDADTESAAAAELLSQRTAPTAAQASATLPGDNSQAALSDPRHNQALIMSEQAAYAHNAVRGPRCGCSSSLPTSG